MVGDGEGHIEVVGLRKRSTGRWVLNGVTFTVLAGETFGLIGPHRLGEVPPSHVVTLDIPDRGDARIVSFAVTMEPPKVRAMIGYVPADSGLYPRLTAEERLIFYAGISAVTRALGHDPDRVLADDSEDDSE